MEPAYFIFITIFEKQLKGIMEKVTKKVKGKLSKKLLKFERKGLISYGKYLGNQLTYASKKDIRKSYKKYIKDQILLNNKKLKKIEKKLK